MAQTVAEQSKRIQTCYKRDAQRIGQSFYTLGHAYNGMNYKYLNIMKVVKSSVLNYILLFIIRLTLLPLIELYCNVKLFISLMIHFNKLLYYTVLFCVNVGSSLTSTTDIGGNGNPISRTTKQLMSALKKTGDAYSEMGGRLMDELLGVGWDMFADMLHVYRGVSSAFPDILSVHRVSIILNVRTRIFLEFLLY